MSDERGDLPDFATPPVIEVALSLQFQPLENFRVAHMGLFWDKVRDRYPHTQELSPVVNVIERFDRSAKAPQVGVEFSNVPHPRLWFVSQDGANLIQLQRDRFARNWRGRGDDYPRYESIRDDFVRDCRIFEDFLKTEALGPLNPTQAEVTYVNHLFAGDGWEHHGQAHKVFRVCSTPDIPSEPEPEDFGFGLKYEILDTSEEPIGRLHVTVNSAYRSNDQKPLFVMQLTSRGIVRENGLDGVLEFLDLGREWIVRRFAALTTPAMHQIWERKDVR